MSENYPWSVLDIPSSATEAEIRRAYARKLKITRPDDDPEGFQALVQARDFALGLASGAFRLFVVDSGAAPRPEQWENADVSEPEQSQPVEMQAAFVDPGEREPSLEDRFREKLQLQPTISDMEVWQDISGLIGRLSLAERRAVEPDLLQAIGRLDWDQVYYNRAFGALLLEFSEEYGWEADSRRLMAFFHDQNPAMAFHDLLRDVRADIDGARIFTTGKTAEVLGEQEGRRYHAERSGGKGGYWGVIIIILLLINAVSRCDTMGTRRDYPYTSPPLNRIEDIKKQMDRNAEIDRFLKQMKAEKQSAPDNAGKRPDAGRP